MSHARLSLEEDETTGAHRDLLEQGMKTGHFPFGPYQWSLGKVSNRSTRSRRSSRGRGGRAGALLELQSILRSELESFSKLAQGIGPGLGDHAAFEVADRASA